MVYRLQYSRCDIAITGTRLLILGRGGKSNRTLNLDLLLAGHIDLYHESVDYSSGISVGILLGDGETFFNTVSLH